MRWPSNQISPVLTFFRPETARRVVVLPAPLAPIRVLIIPCSAARLMPLTASTFS